MTDEADRLMDDIIEAVDMAPVRHAMDAALKAAIMRTVEEWSTSILDNAYVWLAWNVDEGEATLELVGPDSWRTILLRNLGMSYPWQNGSEEAKRVAAALRDVADRIERAK